MPKQKIQRLRAGVAHGGLDYLMTAAVSYLPDQLVYYRHHLMLMREVADLGYHDESNDRVVIASENDVDLLVGHAQITREVLHFRFEVGDTCFMIVENGIVVSSAWAAIGRRFLSTLGQCFDMGDDAFYIYGVFTEPQARRRGLTTLCYQRMFDWFAERRRPIAYAAVDAHNKASLGAHRKFGFKPVGRTRYLRMLGVGLSLCPQWPVATRRWQLLTKKDYERLPSA